MGTSKSFVKNALLSVSVCRLFLYAYALELNTRISRNSCFFLLLLFSFFFFFFFHEFNGPLKNISLNRADR